MEADPPTTTTDATPVQTAAEKSIFAEAYEDFVVLCKLQGKELAARALELERLATEVEGNLSSDNSKILLDHAFCLGVLANTVGRLRSVVTLLMRVGHLDTELSKEGVAAWNAGVPGMEVCEDNTCRPMSNQLARAWRIQNTHVDRVPRSQGRSPFSSGGSNFAALLAAMAD